MQSISISEAKQNFKKYCSDVVDNKDIIIVSRNGNGKENMVWIDLDTYNNLQKFKEKLEPNKNYFDFDKKNIEVKTFEDMESLEDE